MIALDVTPLVLGPRRGVARLVAGWLAGLAAREEEVALLAPGPLPEDVVQPGPLHLPPRPVRSARRFRRRHLPRLLAASGADVLLSPWAAHPEVDRPVVATVHEVPAVRHGPLEGRVRAWRHGRWLRRALADCAAIVVPSRATASDVAAVAGGVGAPVHVVGAPFDPAPWEAAAARATPHGGVVAVGTGPGGWGWRKKGLDVLLGAWSAWGAGRPALHLVGTPPRRLPPGVVRHERPDDEAVRLVVAGARLLVHAARSEGFGYPPLEAMAAGVPVVATRAGALPEVVGQAGVLVRPDDAPALRAAMVRVAEDDGLRATLVEAGRVRVQAFRPADVVGRLLGVLGAVEASS